MASTLEVPTLQVGEQISGLIRKLDRTDGASFVYEVLEELAQRYRLDDVVIRLDQPLGGGLFRLHRAKVDQMLAGRLRPGPRVLFADPDVVPPEVAQTALDLCVLAMRLCMSRYWRLLDAKTGLLTDRSFNHVLEASAAQGARHGWVHTLVILDFDGSDAKPTADEVRRFGRALGSSLRSGDVASRIEWRRFAALLSNSDLDAVNPFLGRVYAQLGGARSNVRLSVGAATTPIETVDPVELRRIATSRLQPGGHDHAPDPTDISVALWNYLELELRLLPSVVHVSREGRGEREIVDILTENSSPTVEAAARRIVEAHGLEVDFEFRVLGAPGQPDRRHEPDQGPKRNRPEEPEEIADRGPQRSGTLAGLSRIVYQLASTNGSAVTEVRLAHRDRTGTGRSSAGELRGAAEATVEAVSELGIDAPLCIESVSTAKGVMTGSPVRVVLSETGSGRRYVGIARGTTAAEAASRATLGALNGFLDGAQELSR